jgi:PKD repeat protein
MPVPGFRYTCNPDGQTVDFFDTTKTSGDSISDWLWEFGEGNSSTLQNPRHTYSGSGTWAVNLTATSSCGAKNTYQEKITTPCFCSPPLANFSTEILSSEPFTIRVRDTSLNPETIINWNWSFGDGTYSTGQNPPDHIYAAGCGEYLISLTVTNDCGTRDTFDKLICCPVYANFTYRMEPANGTAPLTVYFTDRTIGTPQSYGWTFGDGGFSSFKNPVHTYKTGGNYSATLHATSPCGGNETHSERINVNCPPVEALFNYTIVNEDPLIIQFTDLSTGDDIIDWNWYFGDGSMSKEQHPEHTYYFRDDYHVILTIKSACGSESTNSLYLPIGCLPLTITATAHEGGTISPSGNITVPCEWHQQFNITPHTCYDIYDVVIDKDQPNAQHLGPINNYTFVNVQFDQTIDAYFQLKHPQILASANQGGTIDPPGITYLDCGSNQTYTITADSCFNITDVIINGTEHLGPQSSPFTYTFTNVTRDQAIQAQFALKTFPINATAGEGGVISPTGIIYVLCGYNQVFTITSDNCYEISSVLINEIPLPGPFISPFQYTFPNVLQPQTIDAEFSFKNYNITASSGSNGRIVPSGIISVGCGSDRTLTIVPDPGYVVTDIIVNGESVGSYSSYTLSNIQSDQTIHVDFGLSGNWCPITGNVRTQGGTGVSGIRVDVWNQARTILERSGVSRADGSYTIMYPRQSSTHRIDLNCPSTTTWTTTNPSNGWVDNAQICNRNGRCVTLSQNFIGRIT